MSGTAEARRYRHRRWVCWNEPPMPGRLDRRSETATRGSRPIETLQAPRSRRPGPRRTEASPPSGDLGVNPTPPGPRSTSHPDHPSSPASVPRRRSSRPPTPPRPSTRTPRHPRHVRSGDSADASVDSGSGRGTPAAEQPVCRLKPYAEALGRRWVPRSERPYGQGF